MRISTVRPRLGNAGRRVADVEGVLAARDVNDRALVEECGYRCTLERGGHHDDPQVVACPPRLPGQRNTEVGVHAALVKLVEDDGAKRERRDPAEDARSACLRSPPGGGRAPEGCSNRTCQPTSRRAPVPFLGTRWAMARAAPRRGCSSQHRARIDQRWRYACRSPAPGSATTTIARR